MKHSICSLKSFKLDFTAQLQVTNSAFRASGYVKTNGVEVQLYAAYAYDSVIVLADAMQKAGSSEPAKYLGYVQSANVKRITGPIAFDQRGDIKNGAVTTLPKVRLKRRFPCFDDIFYILRTRFF